jgi:hypothetical protein
VERCLAGEAAGKQGADVTTSFRSTLCIVPIEDLAANRSANMTPWTLHPLNDRAQARVPNEECLRAHHSLANEAALQGYLLP